MLAGAAGAGGVWTCPLCTFHNAPHNDACEMCAMPRYVLCTRGAHTTTTLGTRRALYGDLYCSVCFRSNAM